jgi:hypothetical protein
VHGSRGARGQESGKVGEIRYKHSLISPRIHKWMVYGLITPEVRQNPYEAFLGAVYLNSSKGLIDRSLFNLIYLTYLID